VEAEEKGSIAKRASWKEEADGSEEETEQKHQEHGYLEEDIRRYSVIRENQSKL